MRTIGECPRLSYDYSRSRSPNLRCVCFLSFRGVFAAFPPFLYGPAIDPLRRYDTVSTAAWAGFVWFAPVSRRPHSDDRLENFRGEVVVSLRHCHCFPSRCFPTVAAVCLLRASAVAFASLSYLYEPVIESALSSRRNGDDSTPEPFCCSKETAVYS